MKSPRCESSQESTMTHLIDIAISFLEQGLTAFDKTMLR